MNVSATVGADGDRCRIAGTTPLILVTRGRDRSVGSSIVPWNLMVATSTAVSPFFTGGATASVCPRPATSLTG